MGHPLSRLRIKGFKSIKDLDIEVRDINILIGPNAAGKSNLISFFRMLEAVTRQQLQTYVQTSGGLPALLYFGPKITPKLRAEADFGPNGYQMTLVPTEDGRLVFEDESLVFRKDDGRTSKPSLGYGHEETKLHDEFDAYGGSSIAGYVRRSLHDWRVYHFHDTGPQAPPKQTGDLYNNERLEGDAGNLAAFLYLLQRKHPERYDLIRRTVRRIFPQFADFALRPNPFNEERIRLEWRERGSDERFGPHQLSDGTLRFMCLATLLLQPDLPATVVIDEPELGLHPSALGVLAGLVRSAAARTQLILSTQSVTFLDEFALEDIIVVDRVPDTENGAVGEARAYSAFRRLSDEAELAAWLDDYALGELWEMNMLGGRP